MTPSAWIALVALALVQLGSLATAMIWIGRKTQHLDATATNVDKVLKQLDEHTKQLGSIPVTEFRLQTLENAMAAVTARMNSVWPKAQSELGEMRGRLESMSDPEERRRR